MGIAGFMHPEPRSPKSRDVLEWSTVTENCRQT
jgi:hypothetical protein